MTNTKTSHYFRALVALVTMLAAMLVASGAALAATAAFSNPSPIPIEFSYNPPIPRR